MKNKILIALVCLSSLSVFAQVTNVVPISNVVAAAVAPLAPVLTNSLPAASVDGVTAAANGNAWLLTFIPLLVPLLVAIGKFLVPKVPRWILPIAAPALGALIDYLGSLLTSHAASPIAAALLGSAGVGVREIFDQIKTRVTEGPKTIVPLLVLLGSLPFMAGCKSPATTQAFVRTGVATGVAFGVQKSPNAIPYLKAAAPVICSAAAGTNLAPAEVIAALESSPASNLKTPEGVIIMNGALSLYIVLYDDYGADAVNQYPTLKAYLTGTCEGLNLGLAGRNGRNLLRNRLVLDSPHVR